MNASALVQRAENAQRKATELRQQAERNAAARPGVRTANALSKANTLEVNAVAAAIDARAALRAEQAAKRV